MPISCLISPIANDTSTNSVNIPAKRGRGRPRKYANEDEQREARRAQILQSVRKYREKQAETRALVDGSVGVGVSTGSNDSGANGKSKSPGEPSDLGARRRDVESEAGGEARDGDVKGTRHAQVVSGASGIVRPALSEMPAMERADTTTLGHRFVDAGALDDDGVGEVRPINDSGDAEMHVEHNEAPQEVRVSLAVVRPPERRKAATLKTTDLHMNNTSLFLNGLLRDFMVSLHHSILHESCSSSLTPFPPSLSTILRRTPSLLATDAFPKDIHPKLRNMVALRRDNPPSRTRRPARRSLPHRRLRRDHWHSAKGLEADQAGRSCKYWHDQGVETVYE